MKKFKISLGIDDKVRIKKLINKKNVSVVCNISSVNKNFEHVTSVIKSCGGVLKSIMGPQHGFAIDKQDNMKETDHTQHPELKVPVYSLYGEHREPKPHMLQDVDIVVYDLQDVGARYYTFIYTMANVIKLCGQMNKKFIIFQILDDIYFYQDYIFD